MSKHNGGQYYVKAAEKAGLMVEMGKGDHCKIRGPADRGYIIVPLHRELADGTECKIRKWFRMIGIIMAFGLPFLCMIAGGIALAQFP